MAAVSRCHRDSGLRGVRSGSRGCRRWWHLFPEILTTAPVGRIGIPGRQGNVGWAAGTYRTHTVPSNFAVALSAEVAMNYARMLWNDRHASRCWCCRSRYSVPAVQWPRTRRIWCNDVLPNPNAEVILNWAALPEVRTWDSATGIDIDPTDGNVWVAAGCGGFGLGGGCAASPTVDPILKYDRNTGELLASFGAGLFVLPHGLHVDDDGNVWVTDSQGNANGEIGHQVLMVQPRGRALLMTPRRRRRAGQRPRGP